MEKEYYGFYEELNKWRIDEILDIENKDLEML